MVLLWEYTIMGIFMAVWYVISFLAISFTIVLIGVLSFFPHECGFVHPSKYDRITIDHQQSQAVASFS